jgi:hypothetical protein
MLSLRSLLDRSSWSAVFRLEFLFLEATLTSAMLAMLLAHAMLCCALPCYAAGLALGPSLELVLCALSWALAAVVLLHRAHEWQRGSWVNGNMNQNITNGFLGQKMM